MMTGFPRLAELQDRLDALAQQQLLRQRREVTSAQGARITVQGRTLLNFCSNDYLGLANAPELKQAARQAIEAWGVGTGASALVCGHQSPHEQLEQAFCRWLDLPRALLYGTGYLANLGVITALADRETVIYADKLNHASLNDACVLSRARLRRYAHGDLAQLARLMAEDGTGNKLIVTDAVFSMDGDEADLQGLLALARQYDAWLYVDDAHGFGVLGDEGRGSVWQQAVADERIIYMATLGKAAGVAGALVAGPDVLIRFLENTSRPAIYTTAPPAHLAEALQTSLTLMAGGERQRALHARIAQFRSGISGLPWPVMPSRTPIQPILMPDNATALATSARLAESGFWVPAIRPPTVPTPRLRLTLSAAHTEADVDSLLATLHALART